MTSNGGYIPQTNTTVPGSWPLLCKPSLGIPIICLLRNVLDLFRIVPITDLLRISSNCTAGNQKTKLRPEYVIIVAPELHATYQPRISTTCSAPNLKPLVRCSPKHQFRPEYYLICRARTLYEISARISTTCSTPYLSQQNSPGNSEEELGQEYTIIIAADLYDQCPLWISTTWSALNIKQQIAREIWTSYAAQISNYCSALNLKQLHFPRFATYFLPSIWGKFPSLMLKKISFPRFQPNVLPLYWKKCSSPFKKQMFFHGIARRDLFTFRSTFLFRQNTTTLLRYLRFFRGRWHWKFQWEYSIVSFHFDYPYILRTFNDAGTVIPSKASFFREIWEIPKRFMSKSISSELMKKSWHWKDSILIQRWFGKELDLTSWSNKNLHLILAEHIPIPIQKIP